MQFLAPPRCIDFDAQPASILGEPKETRGEGELGPSLLCAASQSRDQARAFDDQIRPR
jgi:hypothetical protein